MKQNNPSAVRNRDEILEVIPRFLPKSGLILEIAAGTGQHCIHFAPHFPGVTWQPSDRKPEALASISAYVAEANIPQLRPPMELDVTWESWPVSEVAGMLCINMVHASTWESSLGLLSGAARVLVKGGPLVLYGAYFREDRETAPSNIEFDRRLRERDPSWGVRQMELMVSEAESRGLSFDSVLDVPNNNYLLVFRK